MGLPQDEGSTSQNPGSTGCPLSHLCSYTERLWSDIKASRACLWAILTIAALMLLLLAANSITSSTELALQFVGLIISWPVVAFLLTVVFREPLCSLLDRLVEVRLPNGIAARFVDGSNGIDRATFLRVAAAGSDETAGESAEETTLPDKWKNALEIVWYGQVVGSLSAAQVILLLYLEGKTTAIDRSEWDRFLMRHLQDKYGSNRTIRKIQRNAADLREQEVAFLGTLIAYKLIEAKDAGLVISDDGKKVVKYMRQMNYLEPANLI